MSRIVTLHNLVRRLMLTDPTSICKCSMSIEVASIARDALFFFFQALINARSPPIGHNSMPSTTSKTLCPLARFGVDPCKVENFDP